MSEFDLLALDENNLIYKIRAIQAELNAAQKSEIQANALSEISPNLGLMTAGEFRSYADPESPSAPGDGFSGVRIAGIGMDYSGELYAITGVNNDSLAFGFRLSDGVGVFGGGNATIGPAGIDLDGLLTIIRQVAENDGNTRTGRLMMTLPDGGSVPVWAMDLTSDPGAELTSNGGFEDGDFSNWTKTTETNCTWTIDSATKQAGDYSAMCTASNSATGVLTSDRIGVTALSNYLISGYIKHIIVSSTGACYVQIKWYDHATAGSLLRTDYLGGWAFSFDWSYLDKTFNAPAGALSCAIELAVATNATGIAVSFFDSFSVTLVATAQRLWLHDDGVKCTNGLYPKRAEMYADGFNCNITPIYLHDAAQNYGFYVYTSSATANNGDWMTTSCLLEKGTYTMKILYSKFSSCGSVRVYLDDVDIGGPIVLYAAGQTYNQLATLNNVSVTYDGYHTIKLLVVDKNVASSDYTMQFTKIWMYQAAD